MQREQLIRALRRFARRRDLAFDVDKARGKGAHYRVRLAGRVSTIQSGDLSPYQVNRICEQLGIDAADL
jgi:hypothetical protein